MISVVNMMNGSHMGNPSFNAAAVAAAIENNGNQIHGASNHSNTDLSKLAVSQTPQGNNTLDTDIKPSVMAGSAGSDRSSPPDSLTAAYNGLNNPQMFNTSMMPQHYSASQNYYEWQALNQHRQMAASQNFAAAAAVAAAAAAGHNGGGTISSPHSAHSGTTANNSTNVNNVSTSTSSSVEAGHANNICGVNAATAAAAAAAINAGASSRSASSANAGGNDSTSIAGTSNESSANINNNNNNTANDGGDGSSHNHSNRDLSRNGFMNQAGNNSYAFDMMNHPMCQPELYNNVAGLAAANPWAYPYPPYQFGGAPYGHGLDISTFGKIFFHSYSNFFF
uniref:Uncharacterized protein n=1 Tax=Panagrolaimus superbus TaxID=310955 RepID=A0A914ZDR2_9BILA